MYEASMLCLGLDLYLEEEIATHSSILAWKIPWTEKPGGLQSMGSQRVRHDWATDKDLIGGATGKESNTGDARDSG